MADLKPGDKIPEQTEAMKQADHMYRQIDMTQLEGELARYVAARFNDASKARCAEGIDADIQFGETAYEAKYSPAELAQLEPGTHVYIPLIQTKCRALQNWMADIMQNAIDRPFTLRPTPISDVPEYLEDVAVSRLSEIAQQGGIRDLDEFEDMVEEARQLALEQTRAAAEKAASRMEDKIEDQLHEGGWRDVYDEFVVDLSKMPGAIIHGPVVERKSRLTWANGQVVQVEEDVLRFRRVDPRRFYPAPGAASVEKAAYLIEVVSLTAKELVDLKRIPGAQPEIISALIARFPDGHKPTHFHGEAEPTSMSSGPERTYDAMIYTGSLPVRLAREYGVDIEGDYQDFVEVELWVCGSFVLRAVSNPYPLGLRPYYISGFQRRSGSIWFTSLPSVLKDLQRLVNASARSLVKNMAFSAGPIAEVNLDMVASEENLESVVPYRVYKVQKDALQGDGRAWYFTTIPSTSPHLLRVYDQFSVEADNVSGIPAFVVGNPNVAGAGRTLGGLSMLMGNAAKGIKRVISMADNKVIQPVTEMLYAINMLFSDDRSIKADAQIVARGAAGLLQKELSQSRAIELLQVLVQPIVAQSGFVPPEAIPRLLRDVAAGMGYDPDIIPDPAAQRDIISTLQNLGYNIGAPQPPSVVSPTAGAGAPIPGVDGRSQPPVDPSVAEVVPAP